MKYLKLFENKDIFDDWDDEEFEKDSKEELIKDIVSSMINIDGSITMGEMVADSSPCIAIKNGDFHLIEVLYENIVEVVVYGGYKGEQVVDTYIMNYNQLNKDILIEIKNLLENYLENYEEEDY